MCVSKPMKNLVSLVELFHWTGCTLLELFAAKPFPVEKKKIVSKKLWKSLEISVRLSEIPLYTRTVDCQGFLKMASLFIIKYYLPCLPATNFKTAVR